MSETINANAKGGATLLFVGYLLQLIGTFGAVLAPIPLLGAAVGGVFGILTLVGVILALVGSAKLKSLNPSCKKGHTLLIVILVFQILVSIFSFIGMVPVVGGVFLILNAIFQLVINILVIVAVSSLVKGAGEVSGDTLVVSKGLKTSTTFKVLMILNLIIGFLGGLFNALGVLLPVLAVMTILTWPFSVIGFIFALISYILVVVFFGKAKSSIAAGNTTNNPSPVEITNK